MGRGLTFQKGEAKMNRFKNHLIVATAALIVLAALSLTNVGRVAAQQTIRDQEYAARNAVQASVAANIAAGSFHVIGVEVFTVPLMKRMVIENVSFHTALPAGQNLHSARLATVLNGLTQHQLVVVPQGTDSVGQQIFVGSQAVRLYADAGSTVEFSYHRSGSVGSPQGSVAISGYLVDIP